MYEKTSESLIPRMHFVKRLMKHVLFVAIMVVFSAIVGAIGFMIFEGHHFGDAVIYAAYILSGFGLMQFPASLGGRLFVALFGLYASLFFIAAFSVISAPIIHRILHKLHLDDGK